MLVFLVALCPLEGRPANNDGFGSSERNEAALIGMLYDFKQTQRLQPIEMKDQGLKQVEKRREDRLPIAFFATACLLNRTGWTPWILISSWQKPGVFLTPLYSIKGKWKNTRAIPRERKSFRFFIWLKKLFLSP